MHCNQGDDGVKRRLIVIRWVAIVVLAIWLLLGFWWFCPIAQADPPHPSKHYQWTANSNGTVTLYFLTNGYYSRYMYQMAHEVEPASNCNHIYGDKIFRLITFDTTHPYWHTVKMKPIMRWDVNRKEFVKLKVD